MRYEDGYTSSWRLCSVSARSWADEASMGHVASASVTRSIDSDAPTIDSANVELSAEAPATGTYVRLWMDARQDGTLARVPIVTGRVAPSTTEVMGTLRTRSDVELESVLKPAEDAEMDEGWYAPQGADGAQQAAALLRSHVEAPVVIDQGKRPALAENVIAGTDTVLSGAWALMGETWEIVTDGMGVVHLRPRGAKVAAVDSSLLCSSLKEGMDEDARMLDYTREWSDSIDLGAHVRVAGEGGLWRVVSQRISCGCGATVDETVKEV